PFDMNRSGITLGEGAATIILTTNQKYAKGVRIMSAAASNDANHISAPSRTGLELGQAISATLMEAKISPAEIDFISAHGTGTIYNDEMEAKALTLSQLQKVPINSLKGYFGHTLGAAGLIESVMALQSLRENLILPTLGFQHSGVTMPININNSMMQIPLKFILKIGAGFGGCNAAIAFNKV
ncbi:MAG: beta-ketoacyl-[acyl-carrier-protein] synthase family protein, partial [Chitinophagaceae bacterium]